MSASRRPEQATRRRLRGIALALPVIAALALLWRARNPELDLGAHAATERRDSSLALTAFQRRSAPTLPATGFAGRVLDVKGAAIARALVCASCANCEASHAPASACTRSDESGRYALSRLPTGRYYLSAVASGYLPLTAYDGEATPLAARELRTSVDFALTEGGARVAGQVLDATGGPIPLAKVRALRLTPPRLSIDVSSDESGRFELTLIPGPFQLLAEADGYAPASKNLEAPQRDVSLSLTPESSLRGVVVAARDGRVVEGVEVRALAAQIPGIGIFRSAISDAQGAFTLRGLEPGSYLLVAKGERWQERQPARVELAVAQQTEGVRVEVEPASSVSGQVRTTQNGAPCREGMVALSPIREGEEAAATSQSALSRVARGVPQLAHIQGDGSIFFPGVAAGSYGVEVRCDGHLFADGPRTLEVATEPLEDLVWQVTPAASLSVRVNDRGGRAVPGAAFDFTMIDGSGRPFAFMRSSTGPDGRMKIPDLAPGEYSVAALGGEPVVVALSARDRQKEVVAVQPAGGTIALSVVTNRDVPVDGVSVSVMKWPEDAPAGTLSELAVSTTRQGDGRYRIGPLPRGRYLLRVADGANPAIELGREGSSLNVSEGAELQLRAVLKRAGKIEGRIVDEHGGPLANVWVTALSESPRSRIEEIHLMMAPRRVLTDLQGDFELDELAEDTSYSLRVEEPSGAVAQKQAVRSGERVTVTLPATATISGEVVAADGKPLQSYSLTATHVETGSARTAAVADPSGRFTLAGITPGAVEVAVMSEAGLFAQSNLQLIPGKRVTGLRLAESRGAPLPPAAPPPAAQATNASNGT